MLIIENNVELCKMKMIEKYKNNNHVELIDIQNLFDELFDLNILNNSNNVKYYIFNNNVDISMIIIVKNQNAYNYYVVDDDDFEIISCNEIETINLLIELIDDNICYIE